MGWFLVGIGIVILNFFVGYHYRKALPQPLRKVGIIASFLLILPTSIYFLLFFLGQTEFSWMIGLSYVAGTYLGILVYSAILFLLFDGCRWILKWLEKKEQPINIKHALFILLVSFAITSVGFINAKDLVVKRYEITLEKKQSSLDQLQIVLLGDLHLGSNIREKELDQIMKTIKELNPDLLVLDGDILDEGTPTSLKNLFFEKMKTLKLRYGIFDIIGNHEFNDRTLKEDLRKMEQAGIQVLDDERILIEDQFYLIGRTDVHQKRASLDSLLHGKKDYPTILLDHRPYFREAISSQEIDLQLSAHTHNGQIVPFHAFDFLTHLMTYGHYQKGTYQMIVTSGTGTWGIPLRVGSNCEIVSIHIKFQ